MIPRIVDKVVDVHRARVDRVPGHWWHRAAIGAVIVGVAAGASAQQPAPRYADEAKREVRRMQDDLRGAALVGSGDELAIATPDGRIRPLSRNGCIPPMTKGGLIKIDCTMLDGPAYYFDASTRAMIESCSFWSPEAKRCPPKGWPVDVPGCDAELPQSITGSWRLYALPGAGGFSKLDNGWTMTLNGEAITFAVNGRATLQRSYEVLERRDGRYSLEISDARSARTRIDLELAPCGLFVESEEFCDAFCKNFAAEVGVPTEQEIREVARRITGEPNGESLERIVAALRQSVEQGPRPLFLERAFFTAASSEP